MQTECADVEYAFMPVIRIIELSLFAWVREYRVSRSSLYRCQHLFALRDPILGHWSALQRMIEAKRIQQKIHLDYIKPEDNRCFAANCTIRGAICLHQAFEMLFNFVQEEEN